MKNAIKTNIEAAKAAKMPTTNESNNTNWLSLMCFVRHSIILSSVERSSSVASVLLLVAAAIIS